MTIRTNLKEGPFGIKYSFVKTISKKRRTAVWHFLFRDRTNVKFGKYYQIEAMSVKFPHEWTITVRASAIGLKKCTQLPDYLESFIDEIRDIFYD